MKRDHVTSYARIGPTRVRVRTQGQGEPLLLVMGIGGSPDMWEPVAKHLPGRELVMFDFPGTGESTISWLPPTMAHNAFFSSSVASQTGSAACRRARLLLGGPRVGGHPVWPRAMPRVHPQRHRRPETPGRLPACRAHRRYPPRDVLGRSGLGHRKPCAPMPFRRPRR